MNTLSRYNTFRGKPIMLAVIDIEASGFGRGSYPIEVGVVMPTGDSHCWLIRPLPHWQHWEAEAAALHGISRKDLIQHGHSPETVAQALNQLLRGLCVYSDAWGHDLSWIGQLFDSVDRVPAFRLDAITSLLSDTQIDAWSTTKERVFTHVSHLQRHRASTDALVVQQTYQTLQDDTQFSTELCPANRASRIQRGRALHATRGL